MQISLEQTSISEYNVNREQKKQLCVVMPAYNEGERIRENLLKAVEILEKFVSDFQIIAVNDGSGDNTRDEILSAVEADSRIACIDSNPNQGKGYAIFAGTHFANAEYIAFLDSDLELNPKMLRRFLSELKKQDADIAIGSKMHKKSRLQYPIRRKVLSFGYFVFLKLLFKLNLKDTQTGIKLFRGEVIKPICENLHTTGFAFDIEILATAALEGRKIIELPIELHFSRDRKAKSRFSVKTIVQIFRDTLTVKKAIKEKKKARQAQAGDGK